MYHRIFLRPSIPRSRLGIYRNYAKSFQLEKEHAQDERIKRRSFKWLLILGTLAIGSSFLASSQGLKNRE